MKLLEFYANNTFSYKKPPRLPLDFGMKSDYNVPCKSDFILWGASAPMNNYELFQNYIQIDHQIDEFYHALAQGFGLSDSALWVLWSLAELGEGCTQKDICRQFFLSKQTVHSSVQKLERGGYLSLRPREGREVSLFLTDRGRDLVREKVLPIMEAERAAASGLTEEEWKTVIRLSRKWLSLFRKETASIPQK